MSCYIVNPEELKAIAAAVIACPLHMVEWLSAEGLTTPAALALHLHQMNAAAYCARYDDAEPGEIAAPDFRTVAAAPILGEVLHPDETTAQGEVKRCFDWGAAGVGCLLYQCSEGNIPETWPAFGLLETWKETITAAAPVIAEIILQGFPAAVAARAGLLKETAEAQRWRQYHAAALEALRAWPEIIDAALRTFRPWAEAAAGAALKKREAARAAEARREAEQAAAQAARLAAAEAFTLEEAAAIAAQPEQKALRARLQALPDAKSRLQGAAWLLELHGKIIPVRKYSLQKSFCYPDDRPYTDAAESAEAFRAQNLEEINRDLIRMHEAPRPAVILYPHAPGIAAYTNDAAPGEDAEPLTAEETACIRFALLQARAELDKRVTAYLNRYGLAHVKTWTYWADA